VKKSKVTDSLGHDAEYAAERVKWYALLADTGFHDIEKDNGELEEHSDHYELNPAIARKPGSAYTGNMADLVSVGIFNAALHRYNFGSAMDRKICEQLAEAVPFLVIKRSLGVGQGRIERVRAEVKAWYDVGFDLLSDVE
jgi:hypothetical protein